MLSLSNYQTSSSSAHELIQTLSLIGLPHPVDDGSGLINHPKALIAQHLISLMEGHSTTMPQLIQGLNAGIEVFSQVLVQKMCICSSKSIFKPNPTQYKKILNPTQGTELAIHLDCCMPVSMPRCDDVDQPGPDQQDPSKLAILINIYIHIKR